jgi:hypothetical protein
VERRADGGDTGGRRSVGTGGRWCEGAHGQRTGVVGDGRAAGVPRCCRVVCGVRGRSARGGRQRRVDQSSIAMTAGPMPRLSTAHPTPVERRARALHPLPRRRGPRQTPARCAPNAKHRPSAQAAATPPAASPQLRIPSERLLHLARQHDAPARCLCWVPLHASVARPSTPRCRRGSTPWTPVPAASRRPLVQLPFPPPPLLPPALTNRLITLPRPAPADGQPPSSPSAARPRRARSPHPAPP